MKKNRIKRSRGKEEESRKVITAENIIEGQELFDRLDFKNAIRGKSYEERQAVMQQFKEEGRLRRTRADFASWDESYISIVYHMALLGAVETDICEALQCSRSTLDTWKKEKPAFRKSLQDGRMKADAKMAASLYHAGLGYSHEDEVILTNRIKEYDEYGRVLSERTEPLRVKTTKHYPPNVKAAIKWLSVRQPEIWAEKKAALNNNILQVNNISFKDFTEDELLLLNRLGLSQLGLEEQNSMPEYADGEIIEDGEE